MYINNITEHDNLLLNLQNEYGYFSLNDLHEMIETFGDDFEVILDCYKHNRTIITLRELNELQYENRELFDDIRSAFLHSEDLHEIITARENLSNDLY